MYLSGFEGQGHTFCGQQNIWKTFKVFPSDSRKLKCVCLNSAPTSLIACVHFWGSPSVIFVCSKILGGQESIVNSTIFCKFVKVESCTILSSDKLKDLPFVLLSTSSRTFKPVKLDKRETPAVWWNKVSPCTNLWGNRPLFMVHLDCT